MEITDEFKFRLRNGTEVIIGAEADVYRDEMGQAWVGRLITNVSVLDTRHMEDAINCLKLQWDLDILPHLEARLIETYDEENYPHNRDDGSKYA